MQLSAFELTSDDQNQLRTALKMIDRLDVIVKANCQMVIQEPYTQSVSVIQVYDCITQPHTPTHFYLCMHTHAEKQTQPKQFTRMLPKCSMCWWVEIQSLLSCCMQLFPQSTNFTRFVITTILHNL